MDIILSKMMQPLSIIFPILACLLFVLGSIVFTRKLYEKNSVKPLANELDYRPPAYSLSKQVDDLTFDSGAFCTAMFLGFAFPFFVVGIVGSNQSETSPWVYLTIFVIYEVFFFSKFFNAFKKLLRIRLGRDCEHIVGQSLMQLMKKGYDVFHDIQMNGYNIDHLVIGPNGIFVVETKGRRKPLVISKNGSKDKQYKILIKEGELHFPNWIEKRAVAQAERQSKSVSNWIQEATGQSIVSSPILVFPGWYIERQSRSPITILNHKELCGTIPRLHGMNISPQLQAQIAYQVRQYNLQQDRAAEKVKVANKT